MTGDCTILMYHVVDAPKAASESRQCCPVAQFDAQMAYLSEHGWNVLPLAQVSQAIADGSRLPDRAVVITFDDGTACTREHALPVLVRYGFPSTVFVVSGLVGGLNEWNRSGGGRSGGPTRAMLTAPQLRELEAGGMEVGSHTVTHVRLAGLPAHVQTHEVFDSRRRLEDMIGKPVRHFAYPYGSFDSGAIQAVRDAGYLAACSTIQGRNDGNVDRFALRRTEIMGSDSLWQFRLKLRLGTHDMPPWSVPRAAMKRVLQRSGVLKSAKANAR